MRDEKEYDELLALVDDLVHIQVGLITHSARFSFVRNTESVREPASNKCTYWSFHYLIPIIYCPLLPIITS